MVSHGLDKEKVIINQQTTFAQKVYEIVRAIPEGAMLTYGQVAALAGRPRAARAVGTILSKNYDPAIPCHRVIRADNKIGGYNRGSAQKIEKLRAEGAL